MEEGQEEETQEQKERRCKKKFREVMSGVHIIGLISTRQYEALKWALLEHPEFVELLKEKEPEFNESYFEILCSRYPGVVNKTPSRKAFKKAKVTKEKLDKILTGIEIHAKDKISRQKHGVFVPEWPNLSTFINQERWEDEIKEISYNGSVQAGPTPQCIRTQKLLAQNQQDANHRALSGPKHIKQLKSKFSSRIQ